MILQITKETPSAEAQNRLLLGVAASPYIAQLTANELASWIQARTICFALADGRYVGFGAWQRITEQWVELGPYFVLSDVQGRGIGKMLVEATMHDAHAYHQYAVSKNPAMHHLLCQQGFENIAFKQLPLAICLHLIRRVVVPTRLISYVRHLHDDKPTRHYIRYATHAS